MNGLFPFWCFQCSNFIPTSISTFHVVSSCFKIFRFSSVNVQRSVDWNEVFELSDSSWNFPAANFGRKRERKWKVLEQTEEKSDFSAIYCLSGEISFTTLTTCRHNGNLFRSQCVSLLKFQVWLLIALQSTAVFKSTTRCRFNCKTFTVPFIGRDRWRTCQAPSWISSSN